MAKRGKIAITVLTILVLLVAGAYFARDYIERQFFKPTGSNIENGVSVAPGQDIKVIARDLTVPWGLAFLPDGTLLVTERSGTLRRVDDDRTYEIEGVRHIGEGGLLGLAIHPRFDENHWIYLYLTTEVGGRLDNRVERYEYVDGSLAHRTVIIKNIPGAANHDGGRLAFGPDGYLYITTGDAGDESLAQDRSSLAGKILRITDKGEIPDDNPSGNAVYSYGHRNPQGLAWDSQGRLWSTEHGRSGIRSGHDELNLIKKDGNYGWPLIEGDEVRSGMMTPVAHSGSDETWAPASLAYRSGSLFFGGLRGETLYQAVIAGEEQVSLKAHLRGEYGRIRTVVFGPDGMMYITTSNTDGRGDPKEGDDKIIRINPDIFGMKGD
ncbi:MAG TPA: PQQ-dependent sugar dehydrogenase [Candidatus Saccharimonadales bacterium]|nr:PQQ-dependent sugar dehydrogenase [Candidatus Saccharimonadales bacterium]